MRYRCIYSSLPAFRPSAKLVPPNMPSADFCAAVRTPYDDLSPVAGTQRRPPEVRPTAFTARPPNLPPRSLMTVDFAIIGSLVRPGRPRYPVLIHRAAALLHASFRPHLAMTPLRFANPSPPSGWIEDFHLQAVDHARHTKKTRRHRRVFSNQRSRRYACGCGSRPGSGSGRGRGLPAGGTAEARGVVGSSTDSRFGFLPLSRS